MNKWIGPRVKQERNLSIHVFDNFVGVVINITLGPIQATSSSTKELNGPTSFCLIFVFSITRQCLNKLLQGFESGILTCAESNCYTNDATTFNVGFWCDQSWPE